MLQLWKLASIKASLFFSTGNGELRATLIAEWFATGKILRSGLLKNKDGGDVIYWGMESGLANYCGNSAGEKTGTVSRKH
jgi:hypothetical protein